MRDDDRPRRRRHDDEDDDRPRRRRRDEDDEDYDDRPRRRKAAASNPAATASLVLGLLSFCLSAVAGIPAVVCGVIGLSKASRTGTGQGMAIAGLILGLAGTVVTAAGAYFAFKGAKKGIDQAMDTVKNVQDLGTLAEVGVGMHGYHDAHGFFPPAVTTPRDLPVNVNKAGLPPEFRSWRADLLPFINEGTLFKQIDRNLAWNDPRNKPAADTPVRAYWASDAPGGTQTRYRVFTGPNTPSTQHPGTKYRLPMFADGSSNTILVAESADLGPWAEPKDMVVSPNGPLPALGKPGSDRFVVAMADGSVRMVRKTIDPQVLRWLIDPKDGNLVPPDFDR